MTVAPTLQCNWDWRAAGNFICGGAGAGLMSVAAGSAWLGTSQYRLAALAALAITGLGLFLVWLEIGRPWRFANVFRNPATSWMSREAWAAVLFFPSGTLGALLSSPVLISLAAVIGLFFLFCQARMLHAARGIPAWRNAAIVPLIVATGLTEGAGLLLAASALIGNASSWLSITFLVLVVWRLVLMFFYAGRMAGHRLPHAAHRNLRSVTGVMIVVGAAIPIALLLAPVPGWAVSIGGLLAVGAGWLLKHSLVCRLALTQGFAIEHAPARGAASVAPGARPGWSH